MAHQLKIIDKHELYNFILKYGLDILQKPELFESVAPGISFSEIKTFFDLYENNADADLTNKWVSEIMTQKQLYKLEPLYGVMSEVMERKVATLESDNPYREVYQFLASLLGGKIPEKASPQAAMVILLLMDDMNRLVRDVKPDQLLACLRAAQGEEASENNTQDEELKRRLLSSFKFQRISEFMNPLEVSSKATERVHECIFKQSSSAGKEK